MSSRIEQIIEEIEEYVESCKYQPLSTTKIVVNKEELNGTRRSSATKMRFWQMHRTRQMSSLQRHRQRQERW